MRVTDSRITLGLYRSRHERGLLEGALKLGVRALDTGYNYLGFTSHRTLARTAGDLLSEFTISTKVGFFPGAAGAEHSLSPRRLFEAVEKSAEDLCLPPTSCSCTIRSGLLLLCGPAREVTAWPQLALPYTKHRQRHCAGPGASHPGTHSPCLPSQPAPGCQRFRRLTCS
jgi:hypothetical protein